MRWRRWLAKELMVRCRHWYKASCQELNQQWPEQQTLCSEMLYTGSLIVLTKGLFGGHLPTLLLQRVQPCAFLDMGGSTLTAVSGSDLDGCVPSHFDFELLTDPWNVPVASVNKSHGDTVLLRLWTVLTTSMRVLIGRNGPIPQVLTDRFDTISDKGMLGI